MDALEKRQLETELLRMGLAGLSESGEPSPELIQQLAAIINNWQSAPNRHGEWIDRHKFLRDLLAECDQANRGEMYGAIVPHLTFKPLPLSSYETMITERVSRLVSKGSMRAEGEAQRPIYIGRRKYKRTTAAESTHAIATLICPSCGKMKRFIADTPVGALIEAKKAGWARLPDKWTCPVCVKAASRKVSKVLVN